MGNLVHELRESLMSCFESIRLSITLFLSTLILIFLIIYLDKIIYIPDFIYLILIISFICIFTGINFLILLNIWIYNYLENKKQYKKSKILYKNLVKESIKLVNSNKYKYQDMVKLFNNYPNPVSLIHDNDANLLVDKGIIRELPDLQTGDNLTMNYSLTQIGIDVCNNIFNK